ncbi:MAG: PilZ domain-containing protein [bacterium]|nr:PilZ domain-containing protein [bacterium]
MAEEKGPSELVKQLVGDMPLNVLIVEKYDSIVDNFRAELHPFRADVVRAETLPEVFVEIELKKLDAVFVDLVHPDLDALHIIKGIRNSSSNHDVPIIALVPFDEIGKLEAASRAGASHFLPKPIVWKQMVQLMQSIHWRLVDDRRHYRRVNAVFPVLCSFDGRKLLGRSVDISSSGILINVEDDLPLGMEMAVAFPYSDKYIMTFLLNARVSRHINKGDLKNWIALEFIDIPKDKAEKLLMWVDLFHYIEEGIVEGGAKE